jgi:hypothetical protein
MELGPHPVHAPRVDQATPTTAAPEDSVALHCYRHADRETWVRCGRCDRPICARCAMQGPVGSRCRDCGRPGPDPLRHLTPVQLAAGLAIALGAGTIVGLIALRVGILASICLGPIVGGVLGEGVMRATGYKRGPTVRLIVLAGLLGGVVVAAFAELLLLTEAFGGADLALAYWPDILPSLILGGLAFVVAAGIGAFARLR